MQCAITCNIFSKCLPTDAIENYFKLMKSMITVLSTVSNFSTNGRDVVRLQHKRSFLKPACFCFTLLSIYASDIHFIMFSSETGVPNIFAPSFHVPAVTMTNIHDLRLWFVKTYADFQHVLAAARVIPIRPTYPDELRRLFSCLFLFISYVLSAYPAIWSHHRRLHNYV